jgi:hypothetical protein
MTHATRFFIRVYFLGFLHFTILQAQTLDSTSSGKSKREIDLFDILDTIATKTPIPKWTKKEPKIEKEIGHGIKNAFSFLPSLNYTPPTSWSFGVLTSIALYTGDHKKTNLSNLQIYTSYTLNHQFITIARSTIWTSGNKYNFVGDWRYLKYPSYTYGLGPNTPITNKELIHYSYLRIYQIAYKNIFPGFYLGLGYNLDDHFKIEEEPGSLQNTDFERYSVGTGTNTISSGLTFNLLYDTRKNPVNPVGGGHYASIGYRYNAQWLGSDQNWESFLIDARKYVSFPRASRNILAFWTYDWFTFDGTVPYLDLPSSAWDTYDNQGRGYIQGRFRSSNLMSAEIEYRFGITRNQLLGGVAFVNVQTVSDLHTSHFDTFYPATGMGIRIKVNKQTNTNISIDYGLGLNGARGFFFNLGEVF